MNRLLQEAHHRNRVMKYCKKHTITEAAIRYKTSRKTVHKWLKRWDGTIESLIDWSKKPHYSPNKSSEAELKLVRRKLKKYRWIELILAYQELCEKCGYTRSYGGFKRIAAKLKGAKAKKRKTHKNKPYQKALYPGEKVQIDVKYVPAECAVDGQKYYQYTAVDECTRWTFREMYDEHSTYSSKDFLGKLIKKASFTIKRVQTDNGTEWTNALLVVKATHKTLFEQALIDLGIEYQRIRIATPRHNGKVERQHRTDGERFYSTLKMYNLEDGRRQLAEYNRKSNNYWKVCLGMKSPNQVLSELLKVS